MDGEAEDLLCEGLDRLVAGVQAPEGIVDRARAHLRHRKIALRAAMAVGTAAVTAAALIAVTGPGTGRGTGGVTNAQTTAYVIGRVEQALAAENFVIQGQATGIYTVTVHGHRVRYSTDPTSSWTYHNRWRMEEFTSTSCGHARPNGVCTHQGGSEPYLAQGAALIGGRLLSAYVTYYNDRYSLSPLGHPHPGACSVTAKLGLGGPAVTISDWPTFIKTILGCTAASVTGQARIGGRKATVISGLIDIPMTGGHARAVRETRVRVRYTLYVDSATYLPLRAYGSTETYGGAAGPVDNAYVTNVRWLPPTKANIARALVSIPSGYQQVSSPASQ